MDPVQTLPWLARTALCVPVAYLVAALFVSTPQPFRAARVATGVALGLNTLLVAGWILIGGGAHAVSPTGSALGAISPTVRIDIVTAVMLTLITFVGFVLVRFSRRYLDGDPGRARYARWMMATLAAVSVLVIANNLLWLGLAWVCTTSTVLPGSSQG